MPETTGKPATRLEPSNAWTVVTDSPLKGLSFAREAGMILAWDEGNQIYLLNTQGESLSTSRLPHRILAGGISDAGGLIALLLEADGGSLMLLSADLDVLSERPAPSESSSVTIDPHGRYIAVGTRQNVLHFINRYGRSAGRLETMAAVSHLCFVPSRPLLVGAAAFGMLVGIELERSLSQGGLDPEIVWQERLMSNVGRLALDGEGTMVLASCFTLGIQRFDLSGRNEGSYHLGGTVSHATPDFPGRSIAAATLEGELVLMNSGGNVRWRTQLARPAIALEFDPLGRYLIYGHATGEIVRLDLFKGTQVKTATTRERQSAAGTAVTHPRRTAAGSVRAPDWLVQVVETEQQAETAVIAVVDDPPAIALFTSPHRLQIYDASGKKLGQGPDMTGVGRIIRTAPGWVAAATDRQIVLCDLRRNQFRRLDVSLVQVTHLGIKPDEFGLAVIQERDRIGRLTTAGRWVWKQELRSTVEDLAVGAQGFAAVSTNSGEMLIFGPAGEMTTGLAFDSSDAPLLVEAPDGSPADVAWLSLARRSQCLRGHNLAGEVIWDRQIPWEGWALNRAGKTAIVTAPDGRALTCDGSGSFLEQAGPAGDANDIFGTDSAGVPIRVSRRGVHLMCATFTGQVRWRAVVEQALGPLAIGLPGTVAFIGKSLAWFANDPPADDSSMPLA